MIGNYVILIVTMENVKTSFRMAPKTRALYFTISQCYNEQKLKKPIYQKNEEGLKKVNIEVRKHYKHDLR